MTNLSTKSGTSSVHGEACEYLRNKIFNANDFFLNATGRPRPPAQRAKAGEQCRAEAKLQPGNAEAYRLGSALLHQGKPHDARRAGTTA